MNCILCGMTFQMVIYHNVARKSSLFSVFFLTIYARSYGEERCPVLPVQIDCRSIAPSPVRIAEKTQKQIPVRHSFLFFQYKTTTGRNHDAGGYLFRSPFPESWRHRCGKTVFELKLAACFFRFFSEFSVAEPEKNGSCRLLPDLLSFEQK